MRVKTIVASIFPGLLLLPNAFAQNQTPPPASYPIKTLNTLRTFPHIESKEDWENRAKEIRQQVLVSCGLWPMPEKTPVRAKISGRIERDGYSIEKVFFQTYPGFYLAGNLYRPLGQGNGPFPGILNAHGHWNEGRLVDGKDCSIAARCINFARQGMIAFSYDMVGYNDTLFAEPEGAAKLDVARRHRHFATDPKQQLWNISLMGLQTWNSIRALDFLCSLPDIDPHRLACTGESGGGTQTFMLGAVDDRLAAQAPIVMVSQSMQGGCVCENAPGLRVEFSNMEIAAVPVPRPQILVGATGDWTKMILEVEGPSIRKIYELFGARDRFQFARFDFNHNYNRITREAVYQFFGTALKPNSPAHAEIEYRKEPDADLRVFPEGKPPADALTEAGLIELLIKNSRLQLSALKPRDKASLENYKKVLQPLWERTFQISDPHAALRVEAGESKTNANYVARQFWLGMDERPKRVPALLLRGNTNDFGTIVVLAHPKGRNAYLHAGGPTGLAKRLLERGHAVVLVDLFLTGELANDEAARARNQFANFFTVYNRTDLQERVLDLALACEFARTRNSAPKVILVGSERAGLWALCAAPLADGVMADCNEFDPSSDNELLAQDIFTPGLRKIGGFDGIAALAAPKPVLLYETGDKFTTQSVRDAYAAAGEKKNLRVERTKPSEDALMKWMAELK